MCRWIAYKGVPAYMASLISIPAHSLVAQSLRADEAKTVTNGDGFGVGWYGDHAEPGLYREIRPAWSDENLKSLCAQVRSHLFFAHVRASTGTAIARANCHPFAHGRTMFMHNGQIGGYRAIKRQVEALIPDDLYAHRSGTTDSEAMFLSILARRAATDMVGAVAATLNTIQRLMHQSDIGEALRFTAAITDGQDLYAFRWASDDKAPSLYWREDEGGLVVVSEPLDDAHDHWREVPKGCALVARHGHAVEMACLNAAMQLAA